jgi:vancomycin resistance protein VanJ
MSVADTGQEAVPATPRSRAYPAAVVYLLTLLAIWTVTRLVAERLWWTTLLLYLPQVGYALPAIVTLPWALRARDRRALLSNAAALAVTAGPLMGFNLPLIRKATSSQPRVRVLAYNIRGGVEGFESIRRQIGRFRPDVVVLTEVSGWGREQQLRAELRNALPGWNHTPVGEVYVASRWPILQDESTPLGSSATRRKVRAIVQAPFGRFNVVAVHFYTAVHGETLRSQWRHLPSYLRRTAAVRQEQVDDVLAWAGTREGPTLIAGDFNTPPAGDFYRRLTRSYADAFAGVGWGWGYTYPARLPLLRIDHVFHSPEWTPLRAEAGGRTGSDHRPLFVELALSTPNAQRASPNGHQRERR